MRGASTSLEIATEQHQSRIKWYNHKRGFGFITGSGSGQPPSPVEPPLTDEGWVTQKKKNKKNSAPKLPVAVEPTPQSS
ncbi:hypothetical protein E2C01_077891 [Portunus trituberculatus]|uniref:Uncharacterized protein n=1 Tax=Portunus trituberculatus TaxID=210409 RepID=A0A5B7IMI0_PORTR|nr:hypothetical protein [Portunus trituberculatus]